MPSTPSLHYADVRLCWLSTSAWKLKCVPSTSVYLSKHSWDQIMHAHKLVMVRNVLTLLQVTFIRSVNKDRLMHEYIPGCYLAKGRCDHLKVPFHTNIQGRAHRARTTCGLDRQHKGEHRNMTWLTYAYATASPCAQDEAHVAKGACTRQCYLPQMVALYESL
jgi:hypothetical protein